MTTEDPVNQLVLMIDPGEDSDTLDQQKLLYALRSELRGLEIESAEPLSEGQVPEGAMGDGLAIGLVVMSLAATLPSLFLILQDWVGRQRRQGCRVQVHAPDGTKIIDISGDALSADEIAAIVRQVRIINTQGGAYVEGDVNVRNGDFVGRDAHKKETPDE